MVRALNLFLNDFVLKVDLINRLNLLVMSFLVPPIIHNFNPLVVLDLIDLLKNR
jgi:hypothetical protein